MDAVDFSTADSSECCVAADGVVAQCNANVVQSRGIRRPEFGTFSLERECGVGTATMTGELTAVGIDDLDLNVRSTVV